MNRAHSQLVSAQLIAAGSRAGTLLASIIDFLWTKGETQAVLVSVKSLSFSLAAFAIGSQMAAILWHLIGVVGGLNVQ